MSVALSDLARAAYCPRQLYYARRDDERAPPPTVRERQELAFVYPRLRDADDATLRAAPIALPPAAYREALSILEGHENWSELARGYDRRVRLRGRDCHGVAHKVLRTDPPVPTLLSPGRPPERGVWKPQRVRAVAAAKALAWEEGREIPRAFVEYPGHAAVRTVRLTGANKRAYRRTLRAVKEMDGPPPRTDDRGKCDACDYASECGVTTRSLRSLLGI